MKRGLTLWLTGLPGTGKTSILLRLEQELLERGMKVELLAEDMLQATHGEGVAAGQQARSAGVGQVSAVCRRLSRNGVVCLVDAVSPRRDARERTRQEIGEVIEIHVTSPLEKRMRRDMAGQPDRPLGGQDGNLTSGPASTEDAPRADLVIDPQQGPPGESLRKVLHCMQERGYLSGSVVPEAAYSEAEEAVVRQRLEDLGYL